jgi:hypothetical protein
MEERVGSPDKGAFDRGERARFRDWKPGILPGLTARAAGDSLKRERFDTHSRNPIQFNTFVRFGEGVCQITNATGPLNMAH